MRAPTARAVTIGLGMLLLVASSHSEALAEEDGLALRLKPRPAPAEYTLTVTTAARVESSDPKQVWRKHQDILGVAVEVRQGEDGTLEHVLTVTSISGKTMFTIGQSYKREEVVGNSQRAKVRPTGEILEATGIPHFSSRIFYGTEDGAPQDMYRVLLALIPRFPDKAVKKGESWRVKDAVAVKEAEVARFSGPMPLNYTVNVKLNREMEFTLVDLAGAPGAQVAQVAFKGTFKRDGHVQEEYNGRYKKANGKVSGELVVAADTGEVVGLTMKSRFGDSYAEDGPTLSFWLNPKERIWLNIYEGTTVPLLWWTDQEVRLERAAKRTTTK